MCWSIKISVSVIIILLFISACDEQKVIVDYDGDVTVVEYVKPEEWLPTYELVLNEEIGFSYYLDGDTTYLEWPIDLLIDENDNIFIVEQTTSHILMFSPQGDFIKSIGSKGNGPGECQHPGPLFKYENYYLQLSQVPHKLIKYDEKFNLLEDIKYEHYPVFWIFKDRQNYPTYVMTQEYLQSGFTRSFHTFSIPAFKTDTLASVTKKSGNEVKGNIYYIDYNPDKYYVMAENNTLWMSDTEDYKIDLLRKNRKIKTISVDYPKEKYIEEEKEKLREEIESGNNPPGIIEKAGLVKKIRNFPTHHRIINMLMNFHDEIWIGIHNADSSNAIFHVYNLQGELTKIVTSEPGYWKKLTRIYIKEDHLYTAGRTDEGGYIFKKYSMEFK